MSAMVAYPATVRRALERLVASVAPLEPEPSSLVVFGSLAKGTFREGESDVNLAVVLEEATPETLRGLAAPLRAAHRAVRVTPLILERREVERLADVFPVKLADIESAHHVLKGTDPFTQVVVEPAHLRLRVEQALRNHLVRLRRQLAFAGEDPRAMGRAIYGATSSLGVELGALLDVAGVARPQSCSAREIFRRAAEVFDLDPAVLAALAAVKEGGAIEKPRALLDGVLDVLRRAVDVADRLEVEG